jgi:hypothetical protein
MTTTTAPDPTTKRRRGSEKPGKQAPDGTRPPTPVRPTKTRRRPALIAVGIALVILGALAMVFITSTLGQTRQVLALTDGVARGAVINAEDLTVVELPAGPTNLQAVNAGDLSSIVGQHATAELLPGSLLTPGSFAENLKPAGGTSIVGVALTSSQMPTETLRAGDKVRIVETPVTGGEPPVDEPRAIEAVVVSTQVSKLGDQTIVNVEVEQDEATALAARSATGRVALVLDSLEG